ncbi:MAG: zinc-binding dehydrogenase, partial [Escherichia coli]|nr:zinc-binding dehydrogenase [Escherichia coli]
KLLPVELAASKGIELVYVNTKGMSDPVQMLRALTDDAGFDDVFVYAAVPSVVEMADELLAEDGCLNFFAGPTDKNFKVPFNFYNVHYNSTHIVGTSGGSTDDMKEAIALSATGQLQPSFMVTHIGGLDAVPETVLNLPDIPGGKKLIYNGVTMPLTAIADFAEKGKTDPLFKELARLVEKTHGIWNEQAEKYLLAQFGVDIGEAAQ